MTAQRLAIRAVIGVGSLILQGFAVAAQAQNPPAQAPGLAPAIVSGVVVDSAGTPIPHAVFSVVGESLRVITDSQGRFRLTLPPGPRLVAVRALGYRPLMWAVTLGAGLEVSGRIRLQQLGIVLPEMTVVGERYVPSRLAGFYQRRRFGLGKYIDPEAIHGRFAIQTADLLQGIAGVHVRGAPNNPFASIISFARCSEILPASPMANPCIVNPNCAPPLRQQGNTVGVYVDGFRILGDPGETLSMINPADVEAIEIYRGPSELPAEFMSDDCAAIVIWTRY